MAAPAACVTSYLPSCLHSHAQATTPTDLCRRNVHVRVQSVGCTMSQLRSRARAQAAAGSPRCAGEDRVFRHSHSDKRDVECKCDRHREIASVARRGQEPCPREIAPCRAAWGRQSSRVGAYLLPARASVVHVFSSFSFSFFGANHPRESFRNYSYNARQSPLGRRPAPRVWWRRRGLFAAGTRRARPIWVRTLHARPCAASRAVRCP